MRKILNIAWLLLSSSAIAETTINCPESYPTYLLSANGVPAEWNGTVHVTGMRMVLRSAGVIIGSPKEEAQGLLIGREIKTKKGFMDKFSDLNNFHEPLEKWAYCAYGLGHNIQLLQRLPKDTGTCVADYSKNPYNGYDIRITCR